MVIAAIGVLANLAMVWYATEPGAWKALGNMNFLWLGGLLITSFIHWFVHALRMKVWVSFMGYRIPYARLLEVAMGTQLGAGISPSAVGGEPLKAGMLIHNGLKGEEAISLTLLNICEDLVFYFIAVPVLFFTVDLGDLPMLQNLSWNFDGMLIWLSGLAGVVVLAYWLMQRLRHSRNPGWLRRFRVVLRAKWESAVSLWQLIGRRGKTRLLFNLVMVTCQWLIRYNVATLLIWGLGLSITFAEAFLLQCVVYFLMMFIPTPGAAVGAEATFYAVFALFLSTDLLPVITAGWRFFSYYFPLATCSVFFLFWKPFRGLPGTEAT